jgi:hypothetical protein
MLHIRHFHTDLFLMDLCQGRKILNRKQKCVGLNLYLNQISKNQNTICLKIKQSIHLQGICILGKFIVFLPPYKKLFVFLYKIEFTLGLGNYQWSILSGCMTVTGPQKVVWNVEYCSDVQADQNLPHPH